MQVYVFYPGPCKQNKLPRLLPTLFEFDMDKASRFCLELESIFINHFDRLSILRVNDVEAAGYSTYPSNNFHIIMLGSGIGWKTFVNKKPLISTSNLAGEVCNAKIKCIGAEFLLDDCHDQQPLHGNLNMLYQWLAEKKTLRQ